MVVERPEQLASLTSPVRVQLLELFGLWGPCAVSDIASHMDRAPDSLYYHVRKLVQVGLLVQARDGTILSANDRLAQIFRMTPDDITDRTSMDPGWQMIDPQGNPVPGELHPSMVSLRTGKPLRNVLRGLFAGDPERIKWVLINTEPIRDPETGEALEVVITVTDVTAMRQTQDALRLSEQRYRLLMMHACVGIADFSADGRVQLLNARAAEFLGGQPKDFVGQTMVDLFGVELGTVCTAR